MDHGELAVVEAGKVGSPDEFFFAFFVEVDAEGDAIVGSGVGEGGLDGEVGYFALRKEFQNLAWASRGAERGARVYPCDGDNTVEKGWEGIDDFFGVGFDSDMCRVYVGVGGFDLEECFFNLVDWGKMEAFVFDIEEDKSLVEHASQMAGMRDDSLVHGKVGEVSYDKLVFHRIRVMSPLRWFWRPASHWMRQE